MSIGCKIYSNVFDLPVSNQTTTFTLSESVGIGVYCSGSSSVRYADWLKVSATAQNGTMGFDGWYKLASYPSSNIGPAVGPSMWTSRITDSLQISEAQIRTAPHNGNSEVARHVYAKYLPFYTVTFKDWDGSTLKTEKVLSGRDATPPSNPSRAGYTFAGWSGSYTNVTSNVTITATYELLVLLDPNGGVITKVKDGRVVPADYFVRVTTGGNYPALPTPTRTGHTFQGWYTALNGGTRVQQGSRLASDATHTIYAHWSGGSSSGYHLYFDPLDGTCSTTSKSITPGTAYGTLPTPTRSGYSFQGWFTDSVGGTAVSSSTVAGEGDTVVYAHWLGNTITLTFNANGGSCSESTRSVRIGAPVGDLPNATLDGYNFDGWFLPGDVKLNSSTTLTASATATAAWSVPPSTTWVIVRHRIVFELNGGTLDAGYECKYTRGVAKDLPTAAEVTKSGATFAGWYESADFSGSVVTSIASTSTGTRTFYARWA